jgi:hypothetical protein
LPRFVDTYRYARRCVTVKGKIDARRSCAARRPPAVLLTPPDQLESPGLRLC